MAISLFFAFYAVSQVGIFIGKRDIVWPWVGAWLPNIVFLASGGFMIWRMR
jgi:lipopolysaccharide export LptBFGC system permease protein LptF